LLEIPTFPVEVLVVGPADPGQACALALPAMVLTLGALWAAHRWAARRGFAISGRETATALQRRPATTFTWTFLALWWGSAVGLPLVYLVLEVGEAKVLERNLLESSEHVLLGWILPCRGALLAVALAAAAAWASRPGGGALSFWLPFATPGALLSFGLIALWNRPLLDIVYNSPGMLVVGTAARFFPLAYFALWAHRRSIPAEQWEAGKLLPPGSASRGRQILRVNGPLAAPGVVLGAVTVFLLQSGELAATLQLRHASVHPIMVRIYDLLHLYRDEDVAALCLWHVGAVLLVAAVLLGCGRLAQRGKMLPGFLFLLALLVPLPALKLLLELVF
jgi:ABC-type Fe3+ transport system permease subunit